MTNCKNLSIAYRSARCKPWCNGCSGTYDSCVNCVDTNRESNLCTCVDGYYSTNPDKTILCGGCDNNCLTCVNTSTNCTSCVDGKYLSSNSCPDCDNTVCGTCQTTATNCIIRC